MDRTHAISRRELCVGLPALAGILGSIATASAQTKPPGTLSPEALPDVSRAFAFDQLPVHRSANGGASRPVLSGRLPTGEVIEVHETTLPPGAMPHPPHKHRHSELMMIREGTVEFEMDERRSTVGPGGVLYAASNTMHGLKNVGSAPANYFVIAIGVEQG